MNFSKLRVFSKMPNTRACSLSENELLHHDCSRKSKTNNQDTRITSSLMSIWHLLNLNLLSLCVKNSIFDFEQANDTGNDIFLNIYVKPSVQRKKSGQVSILKA